MRACGQRRLQSHPRPGGSRGLRAGLSGELRHSGPAGLPRCCDRIATAPQIGHTIRRIDRAVSWCSEGCGETFDSSEDLLKLVECGVVSAIYVKFGGVCKKRRVEGTLLVRWNVVQIEVAGERPFDACGDGRIHEGVAFAR
ncbi:hypothetical protein CcI49_28465 [Frankia sp. CcI49]|nr:hypothetical protein CcI49_28465 [Frankia sp. CcI49]